MPPHTISPTPTSQGLGISLSTLSPPSTQNGQRSHQPVSFTGMGAMPRSGSQPSHLRHESGQGAARPASGRALGPTNTSGAPLYQPGIALKPTHTRGGGGSKGFNTFSALPPNGQAPPAPTTAQKLPPTVRGFIPRGDMSPDSSVESSAFGDDDDDDTPLNSLAGARNGASGSRHARRNKSVDFLRSLSSRNGDPTVSGGAYVPLSGMEGATNSPERILSRDPPEQAKTDNRQSTASSTGATGAVTHNGASACGQPPSEVVHALHPDSFPPSMPEPNTRPYRQAATRGQDQSSGPSHLSRGMSRSQSTPHDLRNEPGPASTKRTSDPSTGLHSRNRALVDAENGAMMLAFSPGRDYRPGQPIFGTNSALLQTPVSPEAPRRLSAEELHEESLRSRPWSNSTMSHHMPSVRPGHRGRSLSDGAGVLARQGTLFHPESSKQRSSAELSLMLGQPKSRRLSGNRLLPPPDLEAWTMAGGASDQVRLEAAKKKKARVEVDVVLERECVVEGGEVRGRLEVTVNGGKRGEGLRVAGGKARVIGFEDISSDSRHIFYHHPYCLPIFDPKEDLTLPLPSLFASGPDEDGYRLAAEGTHSIPFRMRLPLGGGAKGAFTSPGGKGPCVRYVVVGSVKLYIPSTMKRSIAHFYRPIVVLPYLNPSIVLAPREEPVESYIERGLGWSLGGEKGKVEITLALGRSNWVAGQRAWCEVRINNHSSRKIKTVTLALLQTVQTFQPDPTLNTGDFASRLRRRSAGLRLSRDDPGTPEMDACQTTTVRRKLTEESMEADSTGNGEGRVTGKAWWTGVEAGERGHWDMSLLIPNGLLTIRRTRLIEVTYVVRVTVNGSIYADVPINLINFLSIDPPPMPRDALRSPASQSAAVNTSVPFPQARPQPTRMPSEQSLNSAVNPARASSTTLHIDALLQAGKARADAETDAQRQGTETADTQQARPVSIGSEYTLPHAKSLADLLASDPPPLPEMGAGQRQRRPPPQTLNSFLSERSDHTHDPSMYDHDYETAEGGDPDKSMTEARRKLGRQKSLVLAISRAEQRAQEAMDELEMMDESNEGYHALSPGKDSVQLGEFMPDGTPFEHEVYEIGEMPPVPDLPHEADHRLRIRNPTPEPELTAGNDSLDVGDDTVLLDLVQDQLPPIRSSSPLDLDMPTANHDNGYDYDFNPASPQMSQIDDSLRARYADLDPYAGLSSEQYAAESRERYGSYAPSEQESEVGQVVGAVKRNLSVRLPARLVPPGSTSDHGSAESHDTVPPQQAVAAPAPKVSYHLLAAERDPPARSPRTGAPPLHPSPLRQVQRLPSEGDSSDRKASRPLPRFPSQPTKVYEPSDISPRTQPQAQVPAYATSSNGSVQHRSQLRHQISMDSNYGSSEDPAPGLAPSVASDSASSEGHLESPPNSASPLATGTLPDDPSKDMASGYAAGHGPVLAQDSLSSDSHSMPGSPQTAESMLPSVRTKIEQLNTRDEALRKFSVSGAISPATPRASISSNPRTSISIPQRQSIISPTVPVVTSPISTAGRITPPPGSRSPAYSHMQDRTPTKRRSYTTALGPRPTRTTSNDSASTSIGRSPSTHRVGDTTYLTKRSFAQARHISPPSKGLITSPSSYTQSSDPDYSPRSLTNRERGLSISSTSTSATTIEAALMRRPGGPRLPTSPAKKGLSQPGANMYSPPGLPVLPRYGRVSEEDDSDGLV